jgi:Short C-terminal domain
VGLFDFLRRKDEKAIPEPGTPEFDSAVQGSALPSSEGGQSVSMGEAGWTNPDTAHEALQQLGIDPSHAQVEQSNQVLDLRGTGAREQIVKALREHGIDPDEQGQTINASAVPGLQEAILGALGQAGVQIPQAGGVGGAVAPPQQDPLAVIEQLAKKRDAGEITDAEFQAQKQRLLGS